MGAAGWLLWRSLRTIDPVLLWQELRAFPPLAVALALGLTAISHLALTSYDYLGVLYIKRRLAYWRVAIAAFTAYSISHSVGFASVTGTAVRYRLYSRWGFSAVEVAQIMAITGITLFLGMFSIGGVALILDGTRVEQWTGIPVTAANGLGVACLTLVAAYGTIGFIRREPLMIGRFELKIPSPRFALVQIVIAGIDWLLVASVLYVLLPPTSSLSFPSFLSMFVLAYLVGILSNVPGGLGVFETVVLITLTPAVPKEAVLSSLLVYRAVYHLVPLALGGAIFLGAEMVRPQRVSVRRRLPPPRSKPGRSGRRSRF